MSTKSLQLLQIINKYLTTFYRDASVPCHFEVALSGP